MSTESLKYQLSLLKEYSIFKYLIRWILIGSLVGVLAGTASAWLLISLEWATSYREANLWIVWLLPVGGLIIGLMYYYFGDRAVKGNNLLLEEFHDPKKVIPLSMGVLVFIGTVLTHLFGGSAGREGTAVQVGAAISDQFTKLFKFSDKNRKILITIGISAGFASVFGTPLAGAVFGLEVLVLGRMRYEAILPSFIAAVIANWTGHMWPVEHTNYHFDMSIIPHMDPINFLWAALAGVAFGYASMLFSSSTHFFSDLSKKIKYPPLRPVIGGAILAIIFFAMGSEGTKFMGLGVQTIVDSFNMQLNSYDFLLKILFTAFTLGVGFKGGEVTPLFFIGAALGNALVWIIPLPMPVLAGMGFVAVFSGATNTPIACTFMGIELFGADMGVYVGIACVVAYIFSGHTGIYASQIVGTPKNSKLKLHKSKTLEQIHKHL
ncbi:MAG: voltage-gated chloride channel family protein [Flavobacteriaceae bacterium]